MKFKSKSKTVNKHLVIDSDLNDEVINKLKKMRASYNVDFSKLVRGLLEDWLDGKIKDERF